MMRRVPVTAAAGVPLHRQLFLVLRDEIARGALAEGVLLPTEQSLVDQFGVSRVTVRRALADLAGQGYIERRHGIGSFVRNPHPAPLPDATGSFLDELGQIQFESDVEVIEFDIRVAPAPIADTMGTSSELLHILRVRRDRRTAEPLMITEAWLPADLERKISKDALVHTALYHALSGAGVTIDRMQHEITAEIAGPRTAHLLDTAIGSALLRINRRSFAAGSVHHVHSSIIDPSRSRVLLELHDGDDFAIAHDVPRRSGQ